MSDVNPKVAAMTERALKKNPELRSAELREMALKIDKSVSKLSGRQFHARYALQARKKLFGESQSARSAPKGKRERAVKPNGPAAQILDQTFEDLKQYLNQTLDASYRRAIAGNRLDEVSSLLAKIEDATESFA